MKYTPHPYQEAARRFLLEHDSGGLFLDMGLGKTVITLTALSDMLALGDAERVLVIAPLRVARTVWAQEAEKWDHLRHLTFSLVVGSASERAAALAQPADICVINRENVPWLVEKLGKKWNFDTVVIDELSSFKSPTAQRFRALKRVRRLIRHLYGLTGTPTPNGLLDLWPQMYLIDAGESLGTTFGGYKDRYFQPGRRNQNIVFNWTLKPGADAAITEAIRPRVISMRAADYLSLPDRIDIRDTVLIDDATRAKYDYMEREFLLPYTEGTAEVTAANAAVLTNKLLQLASGEIYADDKSVVHLHDAKTDALRDIVESAQGQPVLVYYAYKHELRRIQEAFPRARVLTDDASVADWNRGRVPLLLAHPDSAGHGLNLQQGGHIMVWYTLPWSLEKYEQACARLHRQGQSQPVMIHHLVVPQTVDETVLTALSRKERVEDRLMEHLKAIIKQQEPATL